MEFSNKGFIGCMVAYTSGDYVNFNNMTDNLINITLVSYLIRDMTFL